MPIPVETLRDMNGLNRWFAVSCLLMFASLIWMVWEDYDRPWRGYQDDYMVVQAALAHLDYLDTQTESFQNGVAVAREQVERANVEREANASVRTGLETELAKLKTQHDAVKIGFGNANAIVQVTRVEYEEAVSAHGEDDEHTKVVWQKLHSQEETVADLKLTKDGIEDDQKSLRSRIKGIDQQVADAQKAVDALLKVASDAEEKEQRYTNVLAKAVINAPLMDFTAPKGTESRHEVKQYVLPDVRQELNYLQTYTTDRCTTCHVAIDDKGFTRENLARKFERALPAINEKLIRQSLAVVDFPEIPEVSGDFAPEIAPGQVTEFWTLLSADQQRSYFSELLERVNTFLSRTGKQEMNLSQPIMAHSNLDLFVHVDSSHPAVKIGCTVCHEGNPQETDFVQAAHSPVTHEQEHDWKEKYYVTAAFVPNVTFDVVEHHWDRPMLPPKYSEAGCAKCHTQIADISSYDGESQAKRLNLGRDLFTRAGCVNCHAVDQLEDARKVGPDLTRISSKLERGFTEQWVFNPKAFRPSTWMPHFFMQENNGPGSESHLDENPVLRTETEAQAITHYLFTMSQDWSPDPMPNDLTGDVEKGRKLFNSVGCLACHANVAEFGREMIVADMVNREGRTGKFADAYYDDLTYTERVYHLIEHVSSDRDTVFSPEAIGDRPVFTRHGPDLSAVGMKANRAWLFGWLKNPADYNPNTRMPSLRLTDQEAADIVEYLMTLKENHAFSTSSFPGDNEHKQMARDLVFQLLSSQNSDRRATAIMNDENLELTGMLKGFVSDSLDADRVESLFSGLSLEDRQMMFLGNKMIAHYGCYACHTIVGFEKSPPPGTNLTKWGEKPLSQLDFGMYTHAHDHLRDERPEVFDKVYPLERDDLIEWSQGGNPDEQITHSHAGFAKHKMLNPRIWDRERIKGPYDKIKMPNFYFTEDQSDALVTFLLSRKSARVTSSLQIDYNGGRQGAIAEGRVLARELNCIGCHKIEDNVAVVHQFYTTSDDGYANFDEVNAPPWLRGQGSKVQYAWLYGFFSNVETLRPWLKIRMPTFNLTDEETTTLVSYFAGIAQDEAAMLAENLKPVHKFINSASKKEGGDVHKADYWFATDELRGQAKTLGDYCVANRLMLTFDLDPSNSKEDLAEAYRSTADKADFTRELLDVKFPFSESPRPMIDDERFRLGEAFFYELKCLSCHVLGDPTIEGSNSNPSAPNLDLTHARLSQKWVDLWMQEPANLQPGTKMPQWFPGGRSAFAEYPDDLKTELEGQYGATGADQIALMMDFLYSAGARNYTALQPGGLGTDAGDASSGDDDEESDEEEDEEEEEE